jgi:ABC-type polysaccharide/polyol phosphate export permease
MPHGIKEFVQALPLSQTSDMVRAIAAGGEPNMMGVVVLLGYLVVFSAISFLFIYKKKNL